MGSTYGNSDFANLVESLNELITIRKNASLGGRARAGRRQTKKESKEEKETEVKACLDQILRSPLTHTLPSGHGYLNKEAVDPCRRLHLHLTNLKNNTAPARADSERLGDLVKDFISKLDLHHPFREHRLLTEEDDEEEAETEFGGMATKFQEHKATLNKKVQNLLDPFEDLFVGRDEEDEGAVVESGDVAMEKYGSSEEGDEE